jgi:hypothetical protein
MVTGDKVAHWNLEDGPTMNDIQFFPPGDYDPTVFNLDGSKNLQVAGFSDNTDVYPVVGQLENGYMRMQAMDDGSGESTSCKIDGTADGNCRMSCAVGGVYTDNYVQSGGLWTLNRAGGLGNFTNYVYTADDGEGGGEFDVGDFRDA